MQRTRLGLLLGVISGKVINFPSKLTKDEERQFLVIDEYDSLPPETQDKIKSIALDHNGRNKVYLQDSPVQLEGLKEDIFREISLAQVKGNTNKP